MIIYKLNVINTYKWIMLIKSQLYLNCMYSQVCILIMQNAAEIKGDSKISLRKCHKVLYVCLKYSKKPA